MRKFWKIAAIGLASLAGLVLVVLVVALWLVFTPARLTPIIEGQLPRFVSCDAGIDRVELTFFSSFPTLGLRMDGMRIINPMAGAPCDTLARIDRLRAAIDVKAFLQRKELIIIDIVLQNGAVYLYADSLGRTNYDIMRAGAGDTSAGDLPISRMDAGRVDIDNLDVLYVDDASLMRADVRGLSADLRALAEGGTVSAAVATNRPSDIRFSMGRADSLLAATIEGLHFTAKGSMEGEAADVDITALDASAVTVAYGGERWIGDAAVSLRAAGSANPAEGSAIVRSAALKLAGLEIMLDGSVRIDTGQGIDTDLHYKFDGWPIDRVLALIPASLSRYVDGVAAEGVVSSEGTVRGMYAEGGPMPMIDAKIVIDEGRVNYPAMLPWPLHEVAADLDIHTDLTDAASNVTVNNFRARTPRSSVRARGMVDRLFSDPRAAVQMDLDADLADAAPLIPEAMRFTAAGRIAGRVEGDVRMSQMTAMALDRMKLSGSLTVSGLDARYDTIRVATPQARIDFALPNDKPSSRHTSFAAARIEADHLSARMSDGAQAALAGAHISLETSDPTDTLNIPAVVCDFALDRLFARMDTLSVDVTAPAGRISMEPGRRDAGARRIGLVYHGGVMSGSAGGTKASLDRLDIEAKVVYDAAQKDLWQQLSPRGNIAASGVKVSVPSLGWPVEVPQLAMDFTPLQFRIERARMLLDESDFSLDGIVDNIAAYFRGDDILRAEFNFLSPVTNVTQLLALTSGLGDERLEAEKAADTAAPDEFTGPYMVPKGIDITLHADIGNVLWEGEPLLTDIRGDIQVRDGVLFITPEVAFTSPVTTGNIQLMYRTPAKNNLFAGVGIHLDRIDMQELVRFIPDLGEAMPMLRGFSGRGEFHCAVEGYMDSLYRFKMSTLRGAGSISAVDLALKDDELFRRIAALLKYREEGTLRVDSMRAEFTVLRGEINIYPFLLKVDRYGAVISGRHNLNMNFDYNISLVESPLPFRVAVDVTGSPEDLKFRVFSRSRYPDFYRPRYGGVVENRQMELRNLIRDSLVAGRKEDDR